MISFVVFRKKTDKSIRFAITTNSKKYRYTSKGTGRRLAPGQVLRPECNILGVPKTKRGEIYRISYFKENLLGTGCISFILFKLLVLLKLYK